MRASTRLLLSSALLFGVFGCVDGAIDEPFADDGLTPVTYEPEAGDGDGKADGIGMGASGPGADGLESPEGVPSAPVEPTPVRVPDTASPLTVAVPEILDAEELAFLAALNAYRVSVGVPKVRVSVALARASEAHSTDMAENGWFSHTSSDGTATFTRVRRYYDHNTAMGENIAAGYVTGADVFEGWKNSPGHDAVMKSASYAVVGIARVADDGGRFSWTTDFGGQRDALLSAGVGTIAANGGFESSAITTGTSHTDVRTLGRWHTSATTTGRRTAARFAGSYGVRVTNPDPGAVAVAQVVLGAPGVTYRATAATRLSTGTGGQRLYVEFLDADWKRISLRTVGTGTSPEWKTITAARLSPAGTAYVRVMLYGATYGALNVFDWDAVKLEAL